MRYVIAVGANLGAAQEIVARELVGVPVALSSSSHVASSLYSTAPVGGPEQPDFVNAVVVVESELEPDEVLSILQMREQQAGRVRDVRWGPRTLDLDIIDAGGRMSKDPMLTLPHPRAHERGFVLIPWAEIDRDAQVIGHGAVVDLIDVLAADQHVRRLSATGGLE
jgi:2-amino-4-hydroxy-6-hydroxymethyldihydropteridine diphosphokinase